MPNHFQARQQGNTVIFENALTQTATEEVTVLDLGHDTSLVQRMVGEQMRLCQEFALGVDALVRQCLSHEPPWPIELENAIELTEDAVMPLAKQYSGGAGLILQGFGAVLLANAMEVGGISQTVLNLDKVESLFNRLVAVSQGRPISQETLPTDAGFFATLLILREFMHHLNFSQVTLHI